MYSLTDRVMEVVVWAGFGLYAVARLWRSQARGNVASELAVPTQDKTNSSQPWGIAWCFAAVGLALDWRCAFQEYGGASPFYSEIVLGKAVLIVLACAGAALVAVYVTKTTSRDGVLLFSVFSMTVYRMMSHHWAAHW